MSKTPDTTHQIPAGFVEVSKDRFFALLAEAAAIDPMPHNEPHFTTWNAQRGPRIAWGWSTPGYLESGPHQYAVRA